MFVDHTPINPPAGVCRQTRFATFAGVRYNTNTRRRHPSAPTMLWAMTTCVMDVVLTTYIMHEVLDASRQLLLKLATALSVVMLMTVITCTHLLRQECV